MAEDRGSLGGVAENTIVQSDTASAVIMALLSLVIAWRVYRTYTEREKPIWIIVPAVVIGINLAMVWNSALILYPILPDGSLDTSSPSSASAGTGLYVVALGTVLAIASGLALWKISGTPLVAAWSVREQRRRYEGPAARMARLKAVQEARATQGGLPLADRCLNIHFDRLRRVSGSRPTCP